MDTPPRSPEEPTETVPPDRPVYDWNSGGAWAGRLAFPLLVAGILLGMRAAQALRPSEDESLMGYALLAGCVGSILTGLWMLRLRHRHLRTMAERE